MQTPCRSATTQRRGFTLLEMLIAISIFVILSGLVISAFRESDQDRAAAAAQTVRSMLEGARSRAIHDGQPRGVRLLKDSNHPRMVTSLVYIGAPRQYELQVDNVTETSNLQWQADGNFTHLRNRGLLTSGLRVEVPAYSGFWYPIVETHDAYIRFRGHYHGAKRIAGADVALPYDATKGTSPTSIRLELVPPILPGSTPQPLANQMAIDLDGSKLPDIWGGAGSTPYSDTMDIMFTPRGDVTGEAVVTGVMHLVIADVADITLGVRHTDARSPLLEVFENPDRMVNLFTRTGLVTTSQTNRYNTDWPYAFALTGQEAP